MVVMVGGSEGVTCAVDLSPYNLDTASSVPMIDL